MWLPFAGSVYLFRSIAAFFLLHCLILSCTSSKSAVLNNSKLNKESIILSSVFFDFDFVGSGAYQDNVVPPHGADKLLLPSKLAAGQAYIFHRRFPAENLKNF